jgi:hypothetical protein
MDQDAIDRLQCQFFQNKLATVEAKRIEEAARRVRLLRGKIRSALSATTPPKQASSDDAPLREH